MLFALGLSAAGLGAERSALALQGGEDASTLPVLIDKKNGLAGKLQVSVAFSQSLVSKFTDSTGAALNVQYNLIDELGLELVGAFYASDEDQIVEAARAQQNDQVNFSDLHQMQWLVSGNIVFTPIYGRLSFASEWNPSFDIFLLGGAGIVGTERSLGLEGSVNSQAFQFNFGGGLRIFIIPELAIRIEARNYIFADPSQERDANGVVIRDIGGLTSILVGQVGVQGNISFF